MIQNKFRKILRMRKQKIRGYSITVTPCCITKTIMMIQNIAYIQKKALKVRKTLMYWTRNMTAMNVMNHLNKLVFWSIINNRIKLTENLNVQRVENALKQGGIWRVIKNFTKTRENTDAQFARKDSIWKETPRDISCLFISRARKIN